jgi:hypothetical protein
LATKLLISFPALNPAQRAVMRGRSRFNVVAGAKDSGKSTLALEAALMSPEGALKKRNVALFLPNEEAVAHAKRQVFALIDPLLPPRLDRPRVDLLSGGSILFAALDNPKAAQFWEQVDMVVVDDAHLVDSLEEKWETLLLPALHRSGGPAWFFGKPRSKTSAFYRLHARGGVEPGWSSWTLATSDNPHADAAALEADRTELSADAFRQERLGHFLDASITLSIGQTVIRPGETFRMWCERLGQDGLKVDGKPFVLDDRPAMAWIYDQIPSTEEEAYRLVLVLMKCAQVGFTVMEMLATIYLGLRFGPAIVGMFLPDMKLAGLKSTERFMPIVRTVPPVHKLMTQEADDGSGRKQGEGNVNRRRIADALFIFSWTSGRATTESVPMDMLSFDEVQEMTLEQMEKTLERLSASAVRFTLMGSTANWPEADIHHWYLRGSQHQFHSDCPECGASKPLDEYFPDCIRFNEERGVYAYVCPNGHWLRNPQEGRWVAANPEADLPIDPLIPKRDRPQRIRSIHFPQFLSPTISAGEILFAYNTATNMKNFYNRKLGKPFLDPSQVPVNLEHMARCVAFGAKLGVQWKSRAQGAYMGIDQMGNFNVVVIKERLPDGRQAAIHLEEIYSEDPFARCDELMAQYGIAVCVLEINPNYNEAKKFANRHPGRVFICDSFGSVAEGMIAWGDAPKLDSSDRRTDEDARDRYTLRMDQYKCMQVSMSRFTADEPMCVFPDPQALVQEVVDKGMRQMAAIAPRAFHHFTKTALVAEKDDETNKYKRVVKKVGIDPHFSYANMLCDVAWSRAHGTSTFLFQDAAAPSGAVEIGGGSTNHPTLLAIREEREAAAARPTCGTCTAFEDGYCNEQQLRVQAGDPECVMYMQRPF